MSPTWLPLDVTRAAAEAAARRGVSAVARSPGQFLDQYEGAQGDPGRLDPYWQRRRDAFVARHRAQLLSTDKYREGWDDRGQPTRRHLALAVWAWSPTPGRLRRWLEGQGTPRRNSSAHPAIHTAWDLLRRMTPRALRPWPHLRVTPEPGRASARAHAWCVEPHGGRCTVEVAPKLEDRAFKSICGVLAHELGHAYLLQAGAIEHSERDADDAAELLFGHVIRYDADEVQTWGSGQSPRPAHLPR